MSSFLSGRGRACRYTCLCARADIQTRIHTYTLRRMAPLQSPDQVLAHYQNEDWDSRLSTAGWGDCLSLCLSLSTKLGRKKAHTQLSFWTPNLTTLELVTFYALNTWTFMSTSFLSLSVPGILTRVQIKLSLPSAFCHHGVKVWRQEPRGNVILWRPACIQMFHALRAPWKGLRQWF